MNATQTAGIQNTNNASRQAQPYYQNATANVLAAQGAALPFYGAAKNSLMQGQSNAQPYYEQAASALTTGEAYGHSMYNRSNDAINDAYSNAQPYNQEASNLARSGTQNVNAQPVGADQINQYLNPYLNTVGSSTAALLNQNNQEAMGGQLGNAISSGAFGGDRSGIAAANLSQQQNLANANIYSGIYGNAYNSALGAAQQQQGVNLGAGQANRLALQQGASQLQSIGQQQYNQGAGRSAQYANNAQGLFNIGAGTSSGLANIGTDKFNLGANTASGLANLGQGSYNIGAQTGNSLAGFGAGSQSAALQGATAQLGAGQQEQSTQQAGLTSLYNQFLQQQAYPFQTAQFQSNIAEGTGSLSGSTTTNTQPTGLFGNVLSDRRAKEHIKEMGRAKNGLKIYSFRYKGDPEKVTHIGFMADEVEKKHPEAIGLAGGLKTVDYERASKAGGGGLVFDPNAGAYGLGAAQMPGTSSYVPNSGQSGARRIVFQSTPQGAAQLKGLGDLAGEYKQLKGLYNDGSQIWDAGKNVVSGLNAGNFTASNAPLARGGLVLYRDDGGSVDDPFQSNADLQKREKGLAVGERIAEHAPNSASNGPVSSALASQGNQPKYSLTPSQPSSGNGKNSTGSDLQTLGTLAQVGSDAAPYVTDALAMLALSRGGLVPAREHHAAGDSVGEWDGGDPTLPSTRALPVPDAVREAAMRVGNGTTGVLSDIRNYAGDAVDKSLGRPVDMPGMHNRGLAFPASAATNAGIDISPDDVRSLPDFDPSKLGDVPLSSRHPNNLNTAPKPGLAPSPDAAPSSNPAPKPGLAPSPVRHLLSSPDAARSTTANISPTYSGGMWAAPTYNGSRPDAAPDPSKYGTDRAGQTAFIRDHAIYRGIDPNFALSVAKAEGLNAISPQNPNGASSVDIDPKTGKPFSFGAFQLNVRNGLGNMANAQGIDPTNPDHANLANKFAIDQMAQGGLKPWRGDAAVRAYQQGQVSPAGQPLQLHANVGNEPPPNLQQEPQQPNFMSSLGQFFSGHPDGQTSPNGGMGERALMGVLSGLGAVGSYRGQSILGAALQGLGAGAQGYMQAGKQQADIAQTQATAGLTGAQSGLTGVRAASESVLPNGQYIGADHKLHVIDPRIGSEGIPLMGGIQTEATKSNGSKGNGEIAPPPPISNIDLTGVGYDTDSSSKAHKEVIYGPQSAQDTAQSAEYQDNTRKAALSAAAAAPYTRTLASTLAGAYQQGGINAPGAGFASRASIVGYLNTMTRAFLGPKEGSNYFGDADVGQTLENKINTLQAAARAQGADERTLGALNVFKGANASLEQNPDASAEIAARLMTDQMQPQDRQTHASQWKSDSPMKTVLGAQNDFKDKNPPQKFDKETEELKSLMLNQGKFFQGVNSGKFSPQQISESLKKHGFDPALARYFGRGQT